MLRFSDEKIIEALEKCGGVVSHASKALGAGRNTVDQRIRRNPHLQVKLNEIRESNLDFVESKLMELIAKGQPSAIIFYLKCQGKDRGYVERVEQTRKASSDLMLPVLGPPRATSMAEWQEQNRRETRVLAETTPKPSPATDEGTES